MNILIIDDDPDDTLLFCEALNDLFPSATCISLHSCESIKTILQTMPHPDVIFMDGHMYPIGGKDCLTMLKEVIDPDKTKTVIHSGSLSPKELQEFEDLGVNDVLIKADSYEKLKLNLKNLLVDQYQFQLA
jgi:CheY-like chemotaxis protein